MPCSDCGRWVQNPAWVPSDDPYAPGAWKDQEGNYWVTKCPSCRFNSLIENLRNLRDAANLALKDAEQLQRDAQAHLEYAENSEARGQGRKRPMAPVAPPPEGPLVLCLDPLVPAHRSKRRGKVQLKGKGPSGKAYSHPQWPEHGKGPSGKGDGKGTSGSQTSTWN